MEKNCYPKFTVIIPQKNRAEYLVHTLKTCMIQEYPNFEIIVSDDCSDDNSVEVVTELMKADSRIKLFAHKTHLGMRENFEFALSQVKPGYVMALGGDDGLIPGAIFKMYEIIKQTGRQLLTWNSCYYVYPNADCKKSKFLIQKNTSFEIKYIKSTDFLNSIAKTFMYLVDQCPMFYVTGVVSTELVDRVKSRTPDGKFYYCPTPDGFSGVVLAGEVEEYAYVTEPLSIMGTTQKSQGKAYRRTDKESRKAAEEFFKDSSRKMMHSELASQPYSPLIPLMTADYLLTAKDLPGWPGKFDMFSYDELLKKSFQVLSTGNYEPEVITRELIILKNIAIQHGCLETFNNLMKNTKRRYIKDDLFTGFLISRNAIMFDADKLDIQNIYDACMAVPFATRLYHEISFRNFFAWIKRSLEAFVKSRKIIREDLPTI